MLAKTVTKIANRAALTNPGNEPSNNYGKYLFAIDESMYFYSDGEKWIQIPLDTEEAAPDTEASVICGVSNIDGSLTPIKVDSTGGLVVAGNAKAALFINKSGSTTGVSQQLSGTNQTRQYFLIQNRSTVNIFLNLGEAATTDSLLIAPGMGFIFDKIVPTNAIYIYCATAGNKFVAYEV